VIHQQKGEAVLEIELRFVPSPASGAPRSAARIFAWHLLSGKNTNNYLHLEAPWR